MIGIVITAYNRAKKTRALMETLNKTIWPPLTPVMIVYVDDCSIHDSAVDILHEFKIEGIPIIKIRNEINLGISKSLKLGFDTCIDNGCDTLVNLDNDTIVKPNWLAELNYLHILYAVSDVVTGFNTLSIDLSTRRPRHPVMIEYKNRYRKKSIGGINMLFSAKTYTDKIRPCLEMKGHWDWNVCKTNLRFYCTKPSVIQHTGIDEGKNMNNPDIAHDY